MSGLESATSVQQQWIGHGASEITEVEPTEHLTVLRKRWVESDIE